MTQKRKNPKLVSENIPTEDYFQYKGLNSHSDLESLVHNLIDDVEFLNLNLEKILSMFILPSEDKEIFKRIMMDKLGINSVKEPIIDFLK